MGIGNTESVRGLKLVPGGAPGTPVDGELYHDSATHAPKYYNGAAWVEFSPMPDTWHDVVYDPQWSSQDYPNYNKAQYKKDASGFVDIRGYVKCSGNNGRIGILPVGYRPLRIQIFAVHVSGSTWWLQIEPSGNVDCHTASSCTNLMLDGIRFSLD